MNRTLRLSALFLVAATPVAAVAGAIVAASSIPDGTYTVKVEKVVDNKHVVVAMDNGNETTLGAGRPTVDFSKVQQNDQIKVSLINGNVMVYADLTSHQ
jgi:flagellar hook assembly protein FlgD